MNQNHIILDDPIIFFQKYLMSLVQQSRDFTVLRQPMSKYNILDTQRQYPCRVDFSDQSLKIKFDASGEKSFPLLSIENIQWGSVEGMPNIQKTISMTIKNDSKPLIIHGPLDIMELWFDGLRVLTGNEASTATSSAKIEVFHKAIELAGLNRDHIITIPDPPTSFNFSTKIK